MYEIKHLDQDKTTIRTTEQGFIDFVADIAKENGDRHEFASAEHAAHRLRSAYKTLSLVKFPAPIRVKDHKKFCAFNYISEPSNTFQLGDVVAKHVLDEDYLPTGEFAIGVVIQTFDASDFRTDMWGVDCISVGIWAATLEQITQDRKDLLPDLEVTTLVNA